VKSPEKGAVKTRLAVSIGDDAALALYKCFVADILNALEKTRYTLMPAFHPPDARKKVAEWLGHGHGLMAQVGDDLGERMRSAFSAAFLSGFHFVLLIGSDIPDLTETIIHEAFTSFESHDAVIGPSLDGGYYLIGFKKDTFTPQIFDGIEWSTPVVYAQTMDTLKKAGCLVHILPPKRDMDTLSDVEALFAENADNAFAQSSTMQYLLKRKG